MYYIPDHTPSLEQKISLMQEDSKYDVADPIVSYGAMSDAQEQEVIPDPTMFADIHAPASPPKVPKIFISNNCIFNCAYCGCRAGNEGKQRYCNSPREMAQLAYDTARDNGHGVFITSAIHRNADYTEELIIETLRILRKELMYNGYVHAKVMPGTDPALIEKAARYDNRLSHNVEVAKNSGYERVAKQKNKYNILGPMQDISNIVQTAKKYRSFNNPIVAKSQTTQLMAGSTEEDDRTIIILAKALYKKYGLSRVYYTNFQYGHEAKGYDLPITHTPSWRARRLYQADRLLQLYGFSPDEITPEVEPNLSSELDPKMSWALRNIQLFPIEVNTADYDELLRIPGVGLTFARKIIRARRYGTVTHQTLKKIGLYMNKSSFFLTCNGKYEGGNALSDVEQLRARFSESFQPDINETLLQGVSHSC